MSCFELKEASSDVLRADFNIFLKKNNNNEEEEVEQRTRWRVRDLWPNCEHFVLNVVFYHSSILLKSYRFSCCVSPERSAGSEVCERKKMVQVQVNSLSNVKIRIKEFKPLSHVSF